MRLPKSITPVSLNTALNSAHIAEHGTDLDYGKLLNRRDIQCLYLLGTAPALKREYRAVIVQDYFVPNFEFDAFLPAATFAEINGRVIDLVGKKRRVRKAIDPVGQAKSDDWIVAQLATILDADLKRKRIRRRRPSHAPLRLTMKTSKTFPVHLIVRYNSYGYRSQPLSAILKGFSRLRNDRHVWMDEKTAKKYKLKENEKAKITGKNFTIEMPVKIAKTVPTGFLLIYHHPSMGCINSQPVRIECTKC
jgi:anaerobic selenocysteine-containing dehydrogenase